MGPQLPWSQYAKSFGLGGAAVVAVVVVVVVNLMVVSLPVADNSTSSIAMSPIH